MERTVAANRRLPLAALCAAIVYLSLFWQLGAHTFWDPDEAHYAQTTNEMRASGDWLAPFYNGRPFYDKPIFFHWMQGAAMTLGGATEGPARLPGAIAGALLVLMTGWVGTRLAGGAVGWVSAIVLAVNPGLFGLARYAILDAPFTLCLFGGVSCLTLAAGIGAPRRTPSSARSDTATQWAGYLLLAAAVCIKGPVALALCATALAVATIPFAEARQRLFSLHWILGVLLIVGLAAPWFVYMFWRFRGSFVDGYVLNENLRLFSSSMYANQPAPWFYVQILVVGFLPWTGLILGRAFDQLRGRLRGVPRADMADVMLWSWVGAITTFFSLSTFKLDHYIFPAVPALSILAARAWLDAQSGEGGAGTRVGAALVGPTLVLAGGGVGYIALTRLDLPMSFLAVPAFIALCGAGAVWQQRTRKGLVPVFTVGALMALYVGVVSFVLPALERGKVVPDLARWVQSHASEGDRVGTFRLNRWNPAFRFYVSRPVDMIDSDADARRFLSDPSPFYFVTTEELFNILHGAGAPIEEAYRRDGVWATSGKLLWRAKGQPTVFIVARRVTR